MAIHLHLFLYILSSLTLASTAFVFNHQAFFSLPYADPPPLDVMMNNLDASDNDLIFLTPLDSGSDGLYIYRSNGELVWTRTPRNGEQWGPANLHPTKYNGELHLAAALLPYRAKPSCRETEEPTVTEPSLVIAPGGSNLLFNNKYEIVKTFDPPIDHRMGGHEFYTIDNGSTIVQQYFDNRFISPQRPNDFDWMVHAFDLVTGETAFKWRAMDFIAHDSVCRLFEGIVNPHTNAIDRMHDGNWLINNFGMCCAVKVDARTGTIIWRFGGADTDFTMNDGTIFGYMHHVNERSLDEIHLPAHIDRENISPETHAAISFFDNAWDVVKPPTSSSSSAVIVLLDLRDMTGQVVERYWHPQSKYNPIFGSLYILPNGHRFVGWGQSGEMSEYDHNGKLIYYAGLGHKTKKTILSYRVYKARWSAIPAAPPDVMTYSWGCTSPTVVYVSWNGATDVAAYRVLAGDDNEVGSFSQSATATKDGFETTIWLDEFTPYVMVEALGSDGAVLGRSNVTRVRVPTARARDHCTHYGCSAMNPEWYDGDDAEACLSGRSKTLLQSQIRPEELKSLGAWITY